MSSYKLLHQPVALGLIWTVAALGGLVLLLVSGVGLAGLLGLGAGICLTLITSLTSSHSPGGQALASIIAVSTGALLVGALGLVFLATGLTWSLLTMLGIVSACVFLGFGASATAADSLDFSSTGRSSILVFLTVLPLLIYGLLQTPSLIRHFDETAGDEPWFESSMITDPVRDALFSPEPDLQAMGIFILLLIVLGFTLSYTLPRLSITEVLHDETQERVDATLAVIHTWSQRVVLAGILLFSVLGVGGHIFLIEAGATFAYADLLISFSLMLQESAAIVGLRIILLVMLVLLWGAYAVSGIPAIPRLRHNRIIQTLPTLAGGLLVVGAIHVSYDTIYTRYILPPLQERDPDEPLLEEGMIDFAPTFGDLTLILAEPTGRVIATLGVVVLLLSVFAVLVAVSILEAMEFISEGGDPGGVAGAALAGGGLFLGIEGYSILYVGMPVLAGIIVWDVTRYAQGIVTELGQTNVTVAPVLAHAFSTIVLGLVFLGAIVLLQQQTMTLDPADFSIAVLVLLVIGVIFTFAALKRRGRVSSRVH